MRVGSVGWVATTGSQPRSATERGSGLTRRSKSTPGRPTATGGVVGVGVGAGTAPVDGGSAGTTAVDGRGDWLTEAGIDAFVEARAARLPSPGVHAAMTAT